MTDTKHTPGRWHVNAHNGGDYYGNLTSDLGVRDGVGQIRTIAVILKYAPKPECEANARLIAAAPDLLSIARRWAALDGGSWHIETYANDKKELLADTNAAIAKVEMR